MEAALRVPWDEWAEAAVVGCAIASRRGAYLAAGRLRGGDFYRPMHGRLFQAAIDLDCDGDGQEARIAVVASVTGIPLDEVTRLVDDRPVMWDSRGGFAARVADASRRRQIMQAASDVYNALGAGARLKEVLPLLDEIGVSA